MEDTIVYNIVNNPDVCIENSTSYVFSIIFNANPPQPVAVYVGRWVPRLSDAANCCEVTLLSLFLQKSIICHSIKIKAMLIAAGTD